MSEDDDDQQFERSSKKRKTLPFRCPKYAANPTACEDPKCELWQSYEIANVTRHAKRDAKGDEQMLDCINALAHSKLTPVERWREYCVIFGGKAYDDQASQPYHVHPRSDHLVQDLVSAFHSRLPSLPATASFLSELHDLQLQKASRDRAIDQRKQAWILQIQKRCDEARRNSDARFQQEVAALALRETGSTPRNNNNSLQTKTGEYEEPRDMDPKPKLAVIKEWLLETANGIELPGSESAPALTRGSSSAGFLTEKPPETLFSTGLESIPGGLQDTRTRDAPGDDSGFMSLGPIRVASDHPVSLERRKAPFAYDSADHDLQHMAGFLRSDERSPEAAHELLLGD